MSAGSSLPAELRGIWRRLSAAQRLTLMGVLGVAAILLGVFASAARTPEYAVAFSGLPDEDAAAVVAKLKEMKVPYELGDRGSIRVPASQAQEVRLLLAGQGLPRTGAGVGFEMFDGPHIGMTEFAEKINFQRALEGELSRTIDRLDAVDSSRVHLVLPQQSLFTSSQKETTASVVLQLKSGRRLDPGQVQGIAQLVANSVEGLKTQNVTVMDTAGNLISDRQAAGDPSRMSNTKLEAQQALEKRIE
ncbi:MAG: flagellar M-ring protein FliF, partial [Chloroflexi bacterium]|nr:flagellar M-ring protein FliF [Chloroflexota bacterium]